MDFEHPPPDPLPEVQCWLDEAAEESGLINPTAMTLATVDEAGRPSARIVLLKDLDQAGAVFYTNRLSRKGRELAAHPHATLLFHWDAQGRQIRLDGPVELVSDAESDAYFATRARGSQIGAWASDQSEPVNSRDTLDERVREIEERFRDREVPRPPHWGGYRVSLRHIEFWQGHIFRLHDRVAYTRASDNDAWTVQRLYP